MFETTDYTVINDKTKELILYVADGLKDQASYGATLLNKALYYIDNVNYLLTGKSISSLEYIKQEFGPTPKPSQFLAIKNAMIIEGEMEEKKFDFFGRVQKKCFPLRAPNISVFEKDEIVLIDKVLTHLRNHNATSISELSHKLLAWELASMMETLPLHTSLLSAKAPSDNDMQWAKEKISQYQRKM